MTLLINNDVVTKSIVNRSITFFMIVAMFQYAHARACVVLVKARAFVQQHAHSLRAPPHFTHTHTYAGGRGDSLEPRVRGEGALITQ